MSGQGKTREAQTSPSQQSLEQPKPQEPEGMRRVEEKVDALANGFVTTADTIASMATGMTTALDALSLLRATLEDVQRELVELRANARNGVTMQAPRALTREEVATVIAERPAQPFLVLAPFGALNLNTGDRFDPRTRFNRLDDLPLHVDRGLKITIPPQA